MLGRPDPSSRTTSTSSFSRTSSITRQVLAWAWRAALCTASIAIEGPFTGPVAQVGLEQLHFAQLAVKMDNQANGTDVTMAQDDTQLTPSLATQKTQAIISSNAVAAVGPCSGAPGWRS